MLAAAHNTLSQDKNLVVVVDDAQLLDPLSASLVNQLAAGRTREVDRDHPVGRSGLGCGDRVVKGAPVVDRSH